MMKMSSLAVLLVVLIATFVVPALAQVLISDDFESGVVGDIPPGWQTKDGVTTDEFAVVDSTVKNGSKALKVNSAADDHDMWIEFGRSVTVASVEFWIYPEQVGRGVNFLMLNGSIARGDAGPYLSWGAGTDGMLTRYAAGAWGPTNTPFDIQKWTYVKIVANSDTDTFDIYLGDGPDALPGAPQEAGVPYRAATDGFDRIMFLGWNSVVGPGYIDDILAYEGDVRPEGVITAVELENKTTATWGAVKSEY
jgi:hypothetical protein